MKNHHILSAHVYPVIHQYLHTHPGNYLEIGVFNGVGLAWTAEQFPDRRCTGVDPFLEDGHTYLATGRQTGQPLSAQQASAQAWAQDFANMHLIQQTSEQFFDSVTPDQIDHMQISVVLIDGNHHLDAVRVDTAGAMRMLGSGTGLIVFDDCSMPGVSQAMKEFEQRHATRIVTRQQQQGDAWAIYIGEANE